MTFVLVTLVVVLTVALLAGSIYWARTRGSLPNPSSAADPDTEAPIVVHRWVYFVGLALVVLLGFYIGFIFTHLTFSVSESEWNVGYLMWTVGIFLLLTRIEIVGPDKMVGVEVLGVPTIVVSGGPVILIPVLNEPRVLTRSTVQMELPEEPENIHHGDGTPPAGQVPPIRVTFAEGRTTGSSLDPNDPLNRRLTTEVSAFVRWRIEHFWDFYVRINTLAEARRQLADMAVSELQEKLAGLTVAQTLAQLSRLNDELDNLIREKTENWGIELIDTRIKLLGLSHQLNQAIQSIAESTARKQSTILNAEAEERKRTLEGEGAANAARDLIKGRGEGMKAMAADLSVDGKDVLGAETARAIGESPSSKVIVGADGMRELAGFGAIFGAAAKDEPKTGT